MMTRTTFQPQRRQEGALKGRRKENYPVEMQMRGLLKPLPGVEAVGGSF